MVGRRETEVKELCSSLFEKDIDEEPTRLARIGRRTQQDPPVFETLIGQHATDREKRAAIERAILLKMIDYRRDARRGLISGDRASEEEAQDRGVHSEGEGLIPVILFAALRSGVGNWQSPHA
jgi:hypothetical protein